ncbi:MAG: 4Fe-4S dicluster domain-containing protein [Candidatus Thorarchaeota archaeon]
MGEQESEMERIRDLVRPCFQCGICAASCPVFRVAPQFNPRLVVDEIVRTGSLGTSGNEWTCAFCLMCEQRCPMGVALCEALIELKNISTRNGFAPEEVADMVRAVIHTGSAIQPSRRVQRVRQELDLPPLPKPSSEEITRVLQGTDISALVSAYGGRGTD